MDLTSGYPLWPIADGLIGTYPRLSEDLACDAIVLGAGVTGALVAHRLIDAGIDAVVLDKRDVAMGSTAASTALLQYEIDTLLIDLIDQRGRDCAERAYLACRDAVDELAELAGRVGGASSFERKRSLYLAKHPRDRRVLRKELTARRAIGLRVAWLDATDLAQQFSFQRPAALLSHTAAQVDAYALTHALLRDAHARGLRVFDRTKVSAVRPSDAGVELTTSDGHRVRARWLVFATGYETQAFLHQPVARLVSTYAIVSEPLTSFDGWGQDQCLIWEHARPYLYLRTTADGRAIIGGEDEDFRNPHLRDRLIPRKTAVRAKRVSELFPDIHLDVAFAWTGTFGETQDGLAYIGAHRDWLSTFFALGYGGNGITFSLVAANLIRDAMLGKRNGNADLFAFDR